MSELWQLLRGTDLLAELRVQEIDQPWFYCALDPKPSYSSVSPVFAREAALLDSGDEDARKAAAAAIKELALTLSSPSRGESFSDFILHIKEQRAWFRPRLRF